MTLKQQVRQKLLYSGFRTLSKDFAFPANYTAGFKFMNLLEKKKEKNSSN